MSLEKTHFFSMNYYLIMKSRFFIKNVSWLLASKTNIQIWKKRKIMFRQVLFDLQEIHFLDWMHRDIIVYNLIIIFQISDFRIIKLKLTNFDKLCKKAKNKNDRLSVKMYKVSEVDDVKMYDQCIDIWKLTFAITYAWFITNERSRMNIRQHQSILFELIDASQYSDLILLVRSMLNWNLVKRFSANSCLQHFNLKNVENLESSIIKKINKRIDSDSK